MEPLIITYEHEEMEKFKDAKAVLIMLGFGGRYTHAFIELSPDKFLYDGSSTNIIANAAVDLLCNSMINHKIDSMECDEWYGCSI